MTDSSVPRIAQGALAESETHFAALLDAAPDAAVVLDSDGRIVLVNEQTERVFGYPREEMLGQPVELLLPERFRQIHLVHRSGYLADPKTRPMGADLELAGRRRNGEEFPVDISLSAISVAEGTLAMAYIRDTTARKLAEKALQASEARFRALLNSAPDAAVIVDAEGQILLVNEQTERLFGYPREELVGRPVEILLPPRFHNIHLQHRHGYVADPKTRPMGAGLELAGLRKNGEEVPVDISLSAIVTEEGTLAMAYIRDITDRKRAERELESARDQALELSRLKSQFLANISHEIRTPLNGILGMAQLLLNSELDDTQRRRLSTLRDSGEGLLAIINDILDFSKVEAGKVELEIQDFELQDCLESVMGLLVSSAGNKGLALNLEVNDIPRWVRGDPLRLRQVLMNIVGNAVKFTESGSAVLSVAGQGSGSFRFEVHDTGIGIDASARKRLMDPFSQADASTTRRFGGTGLGLAISSQLVEMMGGTLDFTSEPGVGTTFWFAIDLPESQGPADEPGPGVEMAGSPAGRGAPHRDGAGVRLLLVDDAELNLEVGAGLLEGAGYAVDICRDGSEAVAAVLAKPYAAVLMDCLMPVMDGYEATRRIRGLEGPARHTPVIAVTAAAMNSDREKCLAAGMDDYIAKPLDLDVLLGKLDRWVSGSQNRSDPADPEPQVQGGSDRLEELRGLAQVVSPEAYDRICRELIASTPVMLEDLQNAIGRGTRRQPGGWPISLKGVWLPSERLP